MERKGEGDRQGGDKGRGRQIGWRERERETDRVERKGEGERDRVERQRETDWVETKGEGAPQGALTEQSHDFGGTRDPPGALGEGR